MSFAADVESIYEQISPHIFKTPLVRSDYWSKKLNCNLYFKYDHIQYTGSFKVRGAMSTACELTEEQRAKGFVTASGGNHGLAVCYAANLYDTDAIIFLPEKTPTYKIEKIKSLGGEVRISGETFCESAVVAEEFAKENDKVFIHNCRDEPVIRGQGTLGLEILQEMPETDMICVSIGGGGLISGIARYVKERKPECKMWGAQTFGAHAMYLSLQAGEIVKLKKMTSIAESIGAKKILPKNFEYVRDYVDDVFVVSDEDAMQDLVEILQEDKQLVEPAASCSLSILRTDQVPDFEGKNVVVVLCGSNFPVPRMKSYIANE